jgi:RimJ/RimL family protein N-acetyltransferase
MSLELRNYIEGDYEKHIKSLTKENMRYLFIDNFGGWSDEVSEKKFFEVLNNGFVELFFLKDELLGYVTFNQEKNQANSYLINDIHIVKKFQRQGYGTEILNSVIKKVTRLNANQLKIFVFKNNPSINFYKKKGFKEFEYLKKSNTCVMLKTIK